jgi:hypothetical protein
MTTDLFIVRSVANLRGYKNVGIRWFVLLRATPLDLPVAELVKDYDGIVGRNDDDTEERRHYAETDLHEHFTEAEANALADYLRTSCDDHPFIERVKLPKNTTMPLSYMPYGGLSDCKVLHQREDYPLPFLVEGYYNKWYVYDENGRGLGMRFVFDENGRCLGERFVFDENGRCLGARFVFDEEGRCLGERFVFDENGRFLGLREDWDDLTPEQAALEAERRIRAREADPEAEAKASHERMKQIFRDIAKAHPPRGEWWLSDEAETRDRTRDDE